MSQPAEQATAEVENQEVSHEATLFAEPIFHIGGFNVTNSLINSWITVFILVVLFILIKRKLKNSLRQSADGGPKGIQNVFEVLLENALSLADSVTGERKKTEKFLPVALALFLFVLINNWLGLLPGVGTVGFIESGHGESVFVPILRGGTADLNTTLAIALIAVVLSHIMGVIAVGSWKHLNKFINIESFIEIPRKIKKDPAIVLVNPIKAFVGVIEVIGEVAKVASLSFRLFGNIFAGEVLLASMMALFAFILPLPFIFLEIIVGIIQALIFSMLTLVFMTIATQDHSTEH